MLDMQLAVLWSLVVILVFAATLALLWQRQQLQAAHERERLLERQLAHACGFALAGQMGSANVQEIGNALGSVLVRAGTAQVLALPHSSGDLQQALSDLCAEALVARDGLRRLLTLLQPRDDIREAIDLNTMAADAVRLFEPEARRRGVELILQACPAGAASAGERTQLVLVLLQLIANAVDAMAGTEPAHRRVLVSTHDAGGRVEWRVSDRGHGFGARRPETLFAPYYTTRQGRMGLGLSVARRIVEVHEGRIEARRRAGGGAVFTVSLPGRAAMPATAGAPSASHSPSFALVQP